MSVTYNVFSINEWLVRRHELGQDAFDEMWDGVLHLAPAERSGNGVLAASLLVGLAPSAKARGLIGTTPINVGVAGDYRVPDAAWLSADAERGLYVPRAEAVLEVVSPREDPYAKVAHYSRCGVREMIVAQAYDRTFQILDTADGSTTPHSQVFDLAAAAVEAMIDWS